jgi:hypothetical protein
MGDSWLKPEKSKQRSNSFSPGQQYVRLSFSLRIWIHFMNYLLLEEVGKMNHWCIGLHPIMILNKAPI